MFTQERAIILVAKLATEIRTEVEVRASAHLALWERLDDLILAALEKRS
jgi:hypothetical protein